MASVAESLCSVGMNILPEPIWGPIGKEVYERTYSREKANGDNETWFDTIRRVVDGNCNFVSAKYIENGEKEELFDLFYNMRALPAGRHLWVTGIPGKQYVNNCWGAHWADSFSRHFTFTFERLMEGGGVGANYSNKYIKHYKPFRRTVDLHFVSSTEHKDYELFQPFISNQYSPNWTGNHVITDDREGWVKALEILLDAYYSDSEEPVTVVFDVSIIRPKGSRIRGFGGTASGPAALIEMLHNISKLLNTYHGQKPSSIICMEIDHEIARCVVAGNVRRSARMSIKHWADPDILDFINCKKGERSHWTTNISVAIDNRFFRSLKRQDENALKIMNIIAEGMLYNGEPGIYNIDKASEGEPSEAFTTNPCGEIAFSSPWEQCNLGHVNLGSFTEDQSGLYKAMRLMTRFLIRATYADIPDEEARQVIDRNRRIGVGFFGYHDWVVLQGVKFSESYTNKDIRRKLSKCYELVRKEARDYAFELRIPEPIKVTTVAPTGTIAKLPGVSEGIHPIFSPYFIRRVRFSTVDPRAVEQLRNFEKMGYPVEMDVYSANTKVVTFYIKDPLVEKVEKAGLPVDLVEGSRDIHLQDLLAVQAMAQECFADNAVSFTANIIQSEYTVNDIIEALKIYGPRVKGATVMIAEGYEQMPYERITREEWQAASYRTIGQADNDCESKGACPIK